MVAKSSSVRRGFTLIELLVVVAIIALLISILLPSLAGARRLAKTVSCSAKIHGINLAMQIYASENNNAILGNAHTSGAFLLGAGYSDNNCPNINQCWDWTAPVGKIMNINFDEGAFASSRRARFVTLNNAKQLLCPENSILSPTYTGAGASFVVPTTTMVSYVTASAFQYEYGSGPVYLNVNFSSFSFPGYHPKIGLVGNPSSKVFIADGARWNNDGTSTPDVNLNYLDSGSSPGGQYADWGPFDTNTRSYLKPNNVAFAMRHGSNKANGTMNTYKFNLGFFDGHAETMNGLEGSNPALWAPTGSVITSAEADPAKPDVISKYFSSGTITVP